jgi:hypothetical protein
MADFITKQLLKNQGNAIKEQIMGKDDDDKKEETEAEKKKKLNKTQAALAKEKAARVRDHG